MKIKIKIKRHPRLISGRSSGKNQIVAFADETGIEVVDVPTV